MRSRIIGTFASRWSARCRGGVRMDMRGIPERCDPATCTKARTRTVGIYSVCFLRAQVWLLSIVLGRISLFFLFFKILIWPKVSKLKVEGKEGAKFWVSLNSHQSRIRILLFFCFFVLPLLFFFSFFSLFFFFCKPRTGYYVWSYPPRQGQHFTECSVSESPQNAQSIQ